MRARSFPAISLVVESQNDVGSHPLLLLSERRVASFRQNSILWLHIENRRLWLK
jgi:hypothetical protein